MKIYLIGMPGVGKSTVARSLANKIKYRLLDLDSYIEKLESMPIKDIFKLKGEAYFRKAEAKALAMTKDLDNVVIATGGGIVENLANKSLMEGLIIYLSLPLDLLSKRASSKNRPLLKSNSLNDLFKRRENKYYYFAKHIINNADIDVTITEILRRLENENFNN